MLHTISHLDFDQLKDIVIYFAQVVYTGQIEGSDVLQNVPHVLWPLLNNVGILVNWVFSGQLVQG